ncbi:hypothetical protein ABZ622_37745 [Streptomyces sp. NPDC007164]|uniref:hypothetical protein n=1 Tax=Streptomyces sp. NPDC007164 TaxID=3156918 RepID=UPI0033FF84E5
MATRVEDSPDGEPRGVEGVAVRVLDPGFFQIHGPFDTGRAEVEPTQCHRAGCPDICAHVGMIELECPSATRPEACALQEDPAGDLSVAQPDAPRYLTAREPERAVDAKGHGRQSGEVGTTEVELTGLRPVELQGILEVA